MRMKTPITKEKLSIHWSYNAWKYILVIALAWMGWSLIYQVTAYRPPQEKRIDVFVVSATTTSETVDAFLEPIWKETVPEMELVQSEVTIPIDDYSTQTVLMTRLMTGEKDIVLLSDPYFKNYATQGVFLPLESLVESGAINASGAALNNGYVTMVEEYDAEDRPVKTERHLYGIPLDSFYGFLYGMSVDNQGMYACVVAANHNDENVIPFFNALLEAGRGEMVTQAP